MVASEAGLVVNPVIGGQLVDQIHRLIAGFALLGCSGECHVFQCLTKHPQVDGEVPVLI